MNDSMPVRSSQGFRLGTLPKDFPGFPRLTVIGVVQDLRGNGLDRETNPEVYVPFAQALAPQEVASGSFFLVVRTATAPLTYQRPIEAVVNQLDRDLPIANVRTLEDSLSESLAQRRFVMLLVGVLAGIALILAIAGVYGVMAYVVNQRRREMGIRAALGASPRDQISLVLSQGLRIAAIGILVGLPLSAALSQLASKQLFGVKPVEPTIYASTAALILIVTAFACAIPAFRAARLEPATTLRQN